MKTENCTIKTAFLNLPVVEQNEILRAFVDRKMSLLPRDEEIVLRLSQNHKLTPEQIAARLGIDLDEVKTLLESAWAFMRDAENGRMAGLIH